MARLVKYTSFRSRIPASSGTRPDYLHNIRHLEQKMRSLLQNKKIEDFTSNVELQDAALGYQLRIAEAVVQKLVVSQFVANLARIGECCKQLQRRRNYPMLEDLVDDLDAAAVFAVKRQHEPNFKTALRSLATSLIEQTPFITELITKPKNQPPEDL